MSPGSTDVFELDIPQLSEFFLVLGRNDPFGLLAIIKLQPGATRTWSRLYRIRSSMPQSANTDRCSLQHYGIPQCVTPVFAHLIAPYGEKVR